MRRGCAIITSWVALVILAACDVRQGQVDKRTTQLPTATEIFNLRSKCAELGQKILTDNQVIENQFVKALAQTVMSHYDPRTNRCYVRLNEDMLYLPNKYRQAQDLQESYLFDGQTGESLAHLLVRHDGYDANGSLGSGTIEVAEWQDFAHSFGLDTTRRWPNEKGVSDEASSTNMGFVSALIDAAMADDRKQ
jgi:hypothetical protein